MLDRASPILAALTVVLLDDASRLRGPWRLWSLARAAWVRPSSPAPADREVAARLQLRLVEEAGGCAALAELARVGLVRALLEQRRGEDAATEVGWAWIAARHVDAGRLHDAELAAARAGGAPAVMAWVHELRNEVDRAGAALAEAEAAGPYPAGITAELARVRVRCLVRAGRFEEAVAACDPTLLDVDDADQPEPVRAIHRLLEAELALQAGVPKAAAELARSAFELAEADPTAPDRDWVEPLPAPRVPPAVPIRAAYLLGQALTALGDRDGARAALETALGSCRDAVLVRGWDAVDPALEDRIAAALRVALS